MSAYHMLIGIPGSGKSTLAQYLQQLLPNSCLISTDQIRQRLYGDATHQGQWRDIADTIKTDIAAANKARQAVIYDATNVKRQWRIAFLQDCGGSSIWIGWHLTTPLSQCHHWNQQRKRVVPSAVINHMHQALTQFPPLAAEGFETVHTIDPSQHPDRLIPILKAKLAQLHPGQSASAPASQI